jgi:predicted TIM-barrel fold metal-dependent hydrolase
MKLGRFIVDTHVHAQRHAAGKALGGSKDFDKLGYVMSQIEAYDNSARLIYDMDCYGVDMCVIEPAFGMTNKNSVDQVKKYPQRFVANCNAKEYQDRCARGEEEYTMDGALAELARLMDTRQFVGVGEGMPMGQPEKGHLFMDQETLLKNMMKMMDFGRQYHIPVRYHSGTPGGYAMSYHGFPTTFNPLWAHTLAVSYPDVPIILEHAGIEGGWWEWFYEQALHVAASHKNIYLETGRWWAKLYEKALNDPSVGAEKLIWGTDWGASLPVYSQLNRYPPGYTRQNLKDGIPRHQVDIWGWSLKQIQRLDINQDDMNLMLGGNAVRLYNLRTPGGLTRMFKFVDEATVAPPPAPPPSAKKK